MRQFKHDPSDAFNKEPRRCDVCECDRMTTHYCEHCIKFFETKKEKKEHTKNYHSHKQTKIG